MNKKFCLLDETKLCSGCGECDRCDLDPSKLCDNCMKCVTPEGNKDGFLVVPVGKVQMEGEEYEKWLESEDEDDCDCGHEHIHTHDHPHDHAHDHDHDCDCGHEHHHHR